MQLRSKTHIILTRVKEQARTRGPALVLCPTFQDHFNNLENNPNDF